MVLKTNQILKALQSNEAVDGNLSTLAKKLSTQLEAVQGRMKQNCLDIYSEDYVAGSAASNPERDGMKLLQQLRDLHLQLEKAIPFAQALAATPVAGSWLLARAVNKQPD